MKKLFYVLIITICFFSCEKEQYNFTLDADLEILLLDKSGNNLLDPSNQDAYKLSDIKLYYLIGKTAEEVYYAHLDNPRNFIVLEERGYRIRIFVNASSDEEYPVTYIKWNDSDIDTIKCEFSRTKSSIICRKVWYNEKLMWNDFSKERFFEIVK